MMDKFLLVVLVLHCLVVTFTYGFPTPCKEVGEDCSGETGPQKTCLEDCDEYGSICKLVCLSENEAKILQWTEELTGTGYGSENVYKRVKRAKIKIKIKKNKVKIKYKS
ncbi:uncharacterized protein LOC123538794 [Mercenaria mercenaria]|uniref:uncharacterized protein LOC123538794 n=1 Tax=Mercenaria mercenaria TaxID=6596 RepID=UPI001E1DFC76|nr:uncharacterized protein LOC123538794 [Mercenaria mercenaria]